MLTNGVVQSRYTRYTALGVITMTHEYVHDESIECCEGTVSPLSTHSHIGHQLGMAGALMVSHRVSTHDIRLMVPS
jgi:hypothetical protein